MLETAFGTFDGDSWEKICQICFKLKYRNEQYIEIIASPGDYGIEGFTKSGKVFQCYCPDHLYTRDELYNYQRNKITKDLKKLKRYEKEIKKCIGDTLIKEWIFVTPNFSKNDIVAHCTSKTEEIKQLGLSIIHPDFVVLPQDIEYLIPYIGNALSSVDKKILVSPLSVVNEDTIGIYKGSDSSLVDNALRKHEARLKQNNRDSQKLIERLTYKTIKHFLDGKEIIDLWKDLIQEDYERFIRIVSQYEDEVEELCMFPTDDFNNRLNKIKTILYDKIRSNFNRLDDIMVQDLTNYVIADWILRCPIDFESK